MRTTLELAALSVIACLLPAVPLAHASGAWYGGGSYDGYDMFMEGLAVGNPQVDNLPGATNVTDVSADLTGTLLYSGDGTGEAEVRVYYGTSDGKMDAGEWDTHHDLGVVGEHAPLSAPVTGLTPGQMHFYRLRAVSADTGREGWASSSASFMVYSAPEVDIGPVLPLGSKSATLRGALTAGSEADIMLIWGEGTDPGNWTNIVEVLGMPEGAIPPQLLSGLTPEQEYGYRIYAENPIDEVFSADLIFTTLPVHDFIYAGGSYDGYDHFIDVAQAGDPAVDTLPATNVTPAAAHINGMLRYSGDGTGEAGVLVYYGPSDGEKDAGEWYADHDFGDVAELDPLSYEWTGLDEGVQYFYRFYTANAATGRDAWAPSSESFTTPELPEVAVAPASPVSRTTAVMRGELVKGGVCDVTFFWGEGSVPGDWTNEIHLSASPGPLAQPLAGLSPESEYGYYIFAENPLGDDQSGNEVFTTLTADEPVYAGGPYDGYDVYESEEQLPHPGTLIIIR